MSVRKLKKVLAVPTPEPKVHDDLSTATISTTLSGLPNPTTIAQGLTNLTRLGRAITIKSFRVRINLIPDPTATDPGEIRIVYWLQKYPNGSLMTPSEYLQTVTNIQSFRQVDQSGYRVLYDKVHSFSMADFRNKYLTLSLPLKGTIVEWNEADTLGNSANLRQGYIRGAIMYANFGGTAPSYDIWQRVTFTDA